MPERVVVISDTHLGYESANTEDLMAFLQNDVPRLSPDELVLNGDILDLWRGGIESVMANHSSFLSKLEELDSSGVNVRIIAGNHDWRWAESDGQSQFSPPEPWVVEKRYEFSSGGDQFVIEHGHQYDLANANPISNKGLCLTDDKQAGIISEIYGQTAGTSTVLSALGNREPFIARINFGSLANLSNPDQLAAQGMRERVNRIEDRARSKNEPFTIIGHTHVPTNEDGLANPGSWTLDANHFVLVDGGDVSVVEA